MNMNEFKLKITTIKTLYEKGIETEKKAIIGMEKFDPELHKLLLAHIISAEQVYLHLCKRSEKNPAPEQKEKNK